MHTFCTFRTFRTFSYLLEIFRTFKEENILIDLTLEPEPGLEVNLRKDYPKKRILPRWDKGYDRKRGLFGIEREPRKRFFRERKTIRPGQLMFESDSEEEEEPTCGLVNWLAKDSPVFDYHQNVPFFNGKEWPYVR